MIYFNLNLGALNVKGWAASLVLAGGIISTDPLAAQEGGIVGDTGAAERIAVAEGVLALGQRISAAACYSHAGIEPAIFNAILTDSAAELGTLMAVLENGDPAYAIPPKAETGRVLRAIKDVNALLPPYSAAAGQLADGSAPAEGWDHIAKNNLPLMDAAKALATEVTEGYSNPPELLQSDALMINFAGRQRALAQQISKEACGILQGDATAGDRKRLDDATRIFEASLNALASGYEAAGIKAPPTDEIAAALQAAAADWATVRAELAGVTGAGALEPAAAVSLFKSLDAMDARFVEIAALYVKASKQQL